ncbi:MAG: endo-1,4-beta-xylanase [Kiritimatiellia bacterium]
MDSRSFAALAALVLAVPAACGVERSALSEAYWKIWNDAEQARIDADIERNRKADATVSVAAAPGTVVKVEQLDHAFRFGAHIFNFDQLGSDKCNAAYKASYGRGGLFNQATVSFYWIDHEPTPGAFRFGGDYRDTARYWNSLTREEALADRFWRRPAPGPVIDFLKAKDVAIHGHILIWGNAKPYWLYDWYCPEPEKRCFDALGIPRRSTSLGWEPCGQNWNMGFMGKQARAWRERYATLDERALEREAPVYARNLRRLFRKRVADVAANYGEVVDSWDVVNESACDFARYRRSRTGLGYWFSAYGLMPGDYPLHALLDAKEAIPSTAKLAINDYDINTNFLAQVRDLEREGARIDLVGCQMHIFNTNNSMRLSRGATDVNWVGSPKIIRDRLDMMAKTGKKLHISEVTIAAPGTDAVSREIQAVLARNIYRAWFSHPKTMGITWWNTVDGAGVAGEPLVSGLFTRELEKKPVYDALDRLINHDWRTNLEVATGADGTIAFRGFRGRYRLTWKGKDGRTETKLVDVK